MASELPRRRKRDYVSYREPSSDESISDSASDHAPSRKQPTRRSSRSRRQYPSEAVFDSAKTYTSRSRPLPNERSGRSVGKRPVSYREASTDENTDDAEDYEEDAVVQPRPRATPRTPGPAPRKRSRHGASRPNKPKMRAIGAPLKNRTKPEPTSPTYIVPTDGHKPDLSALPYHVLLQIFVYASHPLHDENMHATSSIAWLVKMARTCQAFAKPALTALYRNPPIFPMKQTRRQLVHHLIEPPNGASQDYQVMVKRLEVDATQMSSLTDTAQSATDLTRLVKALSTLKDVDIFDPLDRPPYRERLRRIRRWFYPDELFHALRHNQLRLQSWRWNSAFCNHGLEWVKGIHMDGPYQSIRELAFVRFNSNELRKGVEEDLATAERSLASAIEVLPNLRSLTFESCTAVNEALLPLLPSTLHTLNITNCINLTSDALQDFLSDRGYHLEELTLNHNQSLDLSFLVRLKQSCPRLDVLRIDCNYYSTLALSSDNEPLYDWLLGLDEVPTWPATLRIIDLEYLRKWNSDIATNFFTSLMNSASELPCLRELRIVTMVDDMGWRQRADFRRKWEKRFEKVFALRCPAPDPHLASFKAYRQWKALQNGTADVTIVQSGNGVKNDSVMTAEQEDHGKHASEEESDSDAPLVTRIKDRKDERWNARRLRSRAMGSTNYEETSDDDSNKDDASEDDADDEEPEVIQGRCNTVVFRLDNLRPREELYDEGDFLDSERSGDEEWNGNDDVDEGYAW